MQNGYNEEYISRVIKEFLDRKSKDKVIYYGPEKRKIYISYLTLVTLQQR